jgi:hypothetical protein
MNLISVILFSFTEADQLFPPAVYTMAASENSRDRDLVEAFIHNRLQVYLLFIGFTPSEMTIWDYSISTNIHL